MKSYSAFDIVGPRMVGPSSSHTAGAARLGRMAWKLAGRDVVKAEITLYSSFAKTGRGHGTDKALVAGILGLKADNPEIKHSMFFALEAGIEVIFHMSDEETDHPNTVRMCLTSSDGRATEVVGASIGGGNIMITELNGVQVEFSGDYPTLIVMHTDVPGVINSVTSILAKENVNVAFMRVFRHVRSKAACMVIETDTPVAPRTLELMRDWCTEIEEVRAV